MHLLPLIAATYFMVSGGPYGIEDILGGAGFGWGILILLILPLVWSLPTALMIGELAAAIPAEGGFYVWVRRALGPFWGYQEGWFSLAASIFDMALYPSLFALYLGKFNPDLTAGSRAYIWALAVVVLCCAWNMFGAPRIGDDSIWMSVLLLVPFAVLVFLGLWKWMMHPPVVIVWEQSALSSTGFSTAMLVAMWNYMGWDNASTVALEVENPQRNYPRAMVSSVCVVAVTYILPLAAMALAGLPVDSFTTGEWTTAARTLGGPLLGFAVVLGGCITGLGMFNALVMSYTRLPFAMAEDGLLPKILTRRNRRGVPWVSVLFCGAAWALALNLRFERLISIDLVLYGTSLMLEFVALIVLRFREPNLHRPFRAGSLPMVFAMAACPATLIVYALYTARGEKILGGSISALFFAVLVAMLGTLFYWLTVSVKRRIQEPEEGVAIEDPQPSLSGQETV